MCLAKAYLSHQEDELLIDHIAAIQVDGEYLIITPLIGAQQKIRASIQSVDFSRSKILINTIE